MDTTTGRMFPLIVMLTVLATGCTGVRPANLGVKDGRLAPCPDTPNCVSSQSNDKEHAIEPLQYSGATSEAFAALKTIILRMKRTSIVSGTDTYLHVEFTSAVWRFVDDVEFYSDERNKVIHLRSASRLGRSDFGVNRKRMEAIRAVWKASGK